MDDERLDRIVSKIDHKCDDKLNWNEFLNFLMNEGMTREVVAEAQIYGFGVKRLNLKERYSLKQTEDKVAEHYID